MNKDVQTELGWAGFGLLEGSLILFGDWEANYSAEMIRGNSSKVFLVELIQ